MDNCNIESKYFYYYNASTAKWETNTWNQVRGGKGYLFYSELPSSCATTFVGADTAVTADIPPLKAGYNLVGTNGTSSYSVDSIKGNCVINNVLYWNDNPSSRQWQSSITTFEAGKAYWVNVVADCSFA